MLVVDITFKEANDALCRKDYNEAVDQYKLVLNLLKKLPPHEIAANSERARSLSRMSYESCADCLTEAGRLQDAIDVLGEYCRNPDVSSSEAFVRLGAVLRKCGLLDSATEVLERALAMNPQHSKAKITLNAVRIDKKMMTVTTPRGAASGNTPYTAPGIPPVTAVPSLAPPSNTPVIPRLPLLRATGLADRTAAERSPAPPPPPPVMPPLQRERKSEDDDKPADELSGDSSPDLLTGPIKDAGGAVEVGAPSSLSGSFSSAVKAADPVVASPIHSAREDAAEVQVVEEWRRLAESIRQQHHHMGTKSKTRPLSVREAAPTLLPLETSPGTPMIGKSKEGAAVSEEQRSHAGTSALDAAVASLPLKYFLAALGVLVLLHNLLEGPSRPVRRVLGVPLSAFTSSLFVVILLKLMVWWGPSPATGSSTSDEGAGPPLEKKET
jgi:hypothetical protein